MNGNNAFTNSWTCTDGVTHRAGSKAAGVWFNFDSKAEAEDYSDSIKAYGLSELVAAHGSYAKPAKGPGEFMKTLVEMFGRKG